MTPLRRPSTVLALVVASIAGTGCIGHVCGKCGGEFEDEPMSSRHVVDDDGLVSYAGGRHDPFTAAGCERLCPDWSGLEDVHSVDDCEATMLDAGDTGAADDTAAPAAIVELTCVVSGQRMCIGGRHTAALVDRAHGTGPDPVAAWLAREAAGEAGSILAFRQLSRELRHHGAPEALVAAARRAAADEVRHTRMVRLLAARRGGTPAAVRGRPTPPRSLCAIALENAVEGCVHETFAAARAGWQARHAADRDVRAVSAILARDEARHADLAAAVHDWMMTALPPEQAAMVEAERRAAWARLAEDPPAVAPAAVRELGLPDARQHRALVAALSAELLIQAA